MMIFCENSETLSEDTQTQATLEQHIDPLPFQEVVIQIEQEQIQDAKQVTMTFFKNLAVMVFSV